jgi:catechol 2,3-dioxygenase-like lactoylglutathione lyase family enzyme
MARPSNKSSRKKLTRVPRSHLPASGTIYVQPLIGVRDVRASRRFYERLLGCKSGMPGPENHPHRDGYERLVRDGRLLLQLHAWDEDDHPNLANRDAAPPGHGVLLWFETDEFDKIVKRARNMDVQIIEPPHFNIIHMEFWIRDPDGYFVVIAGPDEEFVEQDDD